MNADNKHWGHVDLASKTLCLKHDDISCPQYSCDCDDSYILCLDTAAKDRISIIEEFRLTLSSITPDKFELYDCNNEFLMINFSYIPNAADRMTAHFDRFEAWAKECIHGEWYIWHTGGGCMVAFINVQLKGPGKMVSIGVNSECVVLYSYVWSEQMEKEIDLDNETEIFVWSPEDGIHRLKELLDEHVEDPDAHCILAGDLITIMLSEFV